MTIETAARQSPTAIHSRVRWRTLRHLPKMYVRLNFTGGSRPTYDSRWENHLGRMSRPAQGLTGIYRACSGSRVDREPAGCIVATRCDWSGVTLEAASPWPALGDRIRSCRSARPGIGRLHRGPGRAARRRPTHRSHDQPWAVRPLGDLRLAVSGGHFAFALCVTFTESDRLAASASGLPERVAGIAAASIARSTVRDARHLPLHLDRLRRHACPRLQRGHRRGRSGPR